MSTVGEVLRVLTVLLSISAVVAGTLHLVRIWDRVFPADRVLHYGLIGYALTVGYGTAESVYLDVPPAPRTYLVFLASILPNVAYFAPSRYRLIPRRPLRRRDRTPTEES